jgi:hypothetical protein
MFNWKDLHPYPDAFHPQRHQDFAWVKLSVHPHQTISPPLWACSTLKTYTSANAYKKYEFRGFFKPKMYSLTFDPTINVPIWPLTPEEMYSVNYALEFYQGVQRYLAYSKNLRDDILTEICLTSYITIHQRYLTKMRIPNIYLFIFTLHQSSFRTIHKRRKISFFKKIKGFQHFLE